MTPYTLRRLRKNKAIVDFTGVETVYTRAIDTVVLKVEALSFGDADYTLATVKNPQDLCEVLKTVFGLLDDTQEHLVLLILNLSEEITGYKVLASGGQDHVIVDPRIVFRNALLLGAAKIVLAHNHPSGNGAPSPLDITQTYRVARLGNELGIPLVDHVIFAGNRCVSIASAHPGMTNDRFLSSD
ncbi:MAG TPA: JAB domain-containing protein [Candidatus Kapabacteria bacterium]|nr:JAB domain-containing protein [Candidatus Kapabacteria bacterium]